MDFSTYDARHYETVGVRDGYGQWVATYERTVSDLMDLRLLDRVGAIDWAGAARVLDLACGTGRIGRWLRGRGARALDGLDLTPEMLAVARERGIYDRLEVGDARSTGLPAARYEAITCVLAEEHLPDLGPLYAEVARLLAPGGAFALVGYHPFFLMHGIPTHFDRASGEPLAIESHVHLASDHVRAARAAGLALEEMLEGLIDEDWIGLKARWERYRGWPVSYAMVWRKPSAISSQQSATPR